MGVIVHGTICVRADRQIMDHLKCMAGRESVRMPVKRKITDVKAFAVKAGEGETGFDLF